MADFGGRNARRHGFRGKEAQISGGYGQCQYKAAGEKNYCQHDAEKEREFHGSPPMPGTGDGEREGSVTDRGLLPQATWLSCLPSDYWDIPYYSARCPSRSFFRLKVTVGADY